jgi:hypothetical protein
MFDFGVTMIDPHHHSLTMRCYSATQLLIARRYGRCGADTTAPPRRQQRYRL